jgi:hypothetical protein
MENIKTHARVRKKRREAEITLDLVGYLSKFCFGFLEGRERTREI